MWRQRLQEGCVGEEALSKCGVAVRGLVHVVSLMHVNCVLLCKLGGKGAVAWHRFVSAQHLK